MAASVQGSDALYSRFSSRTGTVAAGPAESSQADPIYVNFVGESGAAVGGSSVVNVYQSAALAGGFSGQPGTGGDTAAQGDALRWTDTNDDEIVPLETIGTVDGVRVTFVNGANNPGNGRLVWNAADSTLAWRTPGAIEDGDPVAINGNGIYTLQGANQSTFIRVAVVEDRLPLVSIARTVQVQDRYNVAAGNDVTAAQAAAGLTKDWTLRLANNRITADTFITGYIWFDADPSNDQSVEYSVDEISWYAPKSLAEAQAAFLGTTIPDESYRPIYFRRVLAPGAAAAAARRVVVRVAYELNGEWRENGVRGLYRIENDAEFRIYRKQNAPPVPGVDAVWATASSLPNTPAGTFADGTWYVCVTWFNGYAESGYLRMWRFVVSGGVLVDAPPASPVTTEARPEADGLIRVRAVAAREVDAKNQPDEWAVWYTDDGSAPGSGDPDITETLEFIGGVAVLDTTIPKSSEGTTIKVLVKTRHSASATYSENTSVNTSTAAVQGKADMIQGDVFTGRPGNPGVS
ncbi:MAG: hypothetical protein AB7N71_13665 [Phycisphaerae bacterium]